MYILSQDKTRIYNMSGHIEGIGYLYVGDICDL